LLELEPEAPDGFADPEPEPEAEPLSDTEPSSAATPYGERVPRGAVRPRPSPLVAAGLYDRGRLGSGAGWLDVPEPDLPDPDPEPPDFEPDLEPEPPDLEPEVVVGFPLGFPLPFGEPVPPRLSRSCWARCINPDMSPPRFFGSGGAFRPSAIASSSRCFARNTKCCCPICQRFDVVQ
jgi:hypothetical protein